MAASGMTGAAGSAVGDLAGRRPLVVALAYEPALQNGGGISRYARSLAARLFTHPEVERLHLLARHDWLDPAQQAFDVANAAPAGAATISRSRRILAGAYALPVVSKPLLGVRTLRQRRAMAKQPFDVYHETNYAIRATDRATVATVHDMSAFACPEFHPRDRVRFMHREIPRTLARADAIITLSAFSQQEIIRLAGVPRSSVTVVPIGVDPVFHPRDADQTAETLAAFGLRRRGYLLSAGTLEPRKNVSRVLRAFLALPAALRGEFPLVLVGGRGWLDADLNADVRAAVRTGSVRLLGAVSDHALANLYAAARGMVFLSLYEGQGLPALEAAASGTPVLTSAGSPMADNLGPLARISDPLDIDAIAAGLEAMIINDGSVLAESSAAGIREKFSWERCIAGTLAVYRQALAFHAG